MPSPGRRFWVTHGCGTRMTEASIGNNHKRIQRIIMPTNFPLHRVSLLEAMERWTEMMRKLGTSKWLVIVAGIWIQSTSGSSYTFGIYSELIKSKLGYNQSTLDTIGWFKDIGANVGVLSGVLYGISWPWVVLVAGALQNCIGYFMMWLSVTGRVSRPAVWQMCLYMFLAAHAQTFFNTAVVVTNVRNFPTSRGTVVGLMKGFLGLSGAIMLQIYHTIYEGNQSSYLLLLSWLPTFTSLLFMFVIRIHPALEEEDGKKNLDLFSSIAMLLAAYLMTVIILENILTLGSSSNEIICLFLLTILLFPLAVAMKSELRYYSIMKQHSEPLIAERNAPKEISNQPKNREPRMPERITGVEILNIDFQDEADSQTKESTDLPVGRPVYSEIPENEYAGEPAEAFSNSSNGLTQVNSRKLKRGDNFNLFQAVGTLDFWFLFLAMACGMGSGLVTINNMSQIGLSLGYSSIEISTLVSLWSIWNFLGRFGAGYVSEKFLHSKGYARPVFITITLSVMSAGHLVIASGLPGALYAGSILVGVCYGSQWSLMPTTTSEIFGLLHFGTLFNTISIASPIGSYILSVKVVGYLYDHEAEKEDHMQGILMGDVLSSSVHTCHGAHCFRLSFLTMCGVCLLGCFVSLVLFLRTRQFYKNVVFERIHSKYHAIGK